MVNPFKLRFWTWVVWISIQVRYVKWCGPKWSSNKIWERCGPAPLECGMWLIPLQNALPNITVQNLVILSHKIWGHQKNLGSVGTGPLRWRRWWSLLKHAIPHITMPNLIAIGQTVHHKVPQIHQKKKLDPSCLTFEGHSRLSKV